MPPLSRDAIFGVLSGLTLLGCDKAAPASAEPLPSAAAVAPAAPVPSGGVSAKEVAPAAGSAEKPQSCAPGGCAPGKCGGGEHEKK
jgi:hypothetical protein